MADRLRHIARRLWLRGYLPTILIALLWLLSPGLWIFWQGASANQLRGVLARGVVAVEWNSTRRGFGLGTPTWRLGTNLTVNGQRVTWFTQQPLWSASRFWSSRSHLLELRPILHSGHVRIPLVYAAFLTAFPPTILAWRRSRRAHPGHCPHCGYDLRGSPPRPCPECGKTATPTDSPPVRPSVPE